MNYKAIVIGLGIGVGISYATNYNYAYFTENIYQDNIIKIEMPPIEENDKHTFETIATIDGDYFNKILIVLDEHYNIDIEFKLSIKQKYGVFKERLFTIVTQVAEGISINLTSGKVFKLSEFESELPSSNKLDVVLKYKENNEIHEKEYTIDFIKDKENTNILKVYFTEKS